MSSFPLRATIVFAAGIVALSLLGFFLPNIFTWGFHFLGFLPKSALLLFLVLAVTGTISISRGRADAGLQRLATVFEHTPWMILSGAIGVFIFLAVTFRVQVPLLGDSFIAIKIFSKTVQGPQVIPPSHQPLAFYYFYVFLKLFGAFDYPELLNAFLAGELILGAGFIIAAYVTVRSLFEEPLYRCLAFLFLLVLPSMELFFGYVELYGITLFLLGAYLCVSVLYLRGRIHFAIVPAVFALLVLSHYLNIFLVPSLLYLIALAYRRQGIRPLAVSAAVLLVIVLLALLMVNFHADKLIPPDRGTPILTVTPSDNVYQAYTQFSPYHFTDLFNLAILLFPGAFFLIGMTFRRHRSHLTGSPVSRFLLIAIVPIMAFIVIARFDIPMAQDWDVPASYAYLVAVYALVVAEPWMEDRGKILGLLVLVTFLTSTAWWYLNSTVTPNIERVRQFIDTRISSHDGIYQSTFHLGEYFIRTHDTKSIVDISENFIRLYPKDKRGYSNYTLYLQQFGKPMDEKINEIFGRWLAVDSASADAHEQYANFQLDIGNRSYRDGLYAEAIGHYHKAIELQPAMPDAYNGLGITYRRMGENDSALYYYLQTLRLDSSNTYAYINLGNLFDDTGNPEQAIAWYKKALVLQPNSSQLHYNIGITYYNKGDVPNALSSLREAARLGDADAQAFLREHGE